MKTNNLRLDVAGDAFACAVMSNYTFMPLMKKMPFYGRRKLFKLRKHFDKMLDAIVEKRHAMRMRKCEEERL